MASTSTTSTAPSQPGSVLGAFALITGTTVGAGIIALPQSTISAGFVPSATLLVGLWAVLTLEALLIAEVNLRCHAERRAAGDESSRIIPLAEMASHTIGPIGHAAVTSVYLCLAFTLLMAYTARGGDILSTQLSGLHINAAMGSVLFAASLGFAILRGGTGGAEKLNSALTGVLMMLFVVLVGGGAMQADWSAGLSHADWSQTARCTPIMFLALMYHDIIPLMCHFLGFERSKIRTALLCGSVVPLAMYLSWEAVSLALVPFQGGLTADPIDVLIATQGGVGSALITGFCLAALATSFIGTGLSFIGYLENVVDRAASRLTSPSSLSSSLLTNSTSNSAPNATAADPTSARNAQDLDAGKSGTRAAESMDWQRTLAVLLALAPPTYFSMGNPDMFATATHLAGGYGMTLLYGALPPVLAWHSRARQTTAGAEPMVGGGRLVLGSLLAAGILAETLQLPMDAASSAPSPVYELAAAGDAVAEALHNVLMFIQ